MHVTITAGCAPLNKQPRRIVRISDYYSLPIIPMDFAMIVDINPWEEHHFLTISFVLLFLPFVCFLDDALFINLNFDLFPRVPYAY